MNKCSKGRKRLTITFSVLLIALGTTVFSNAPEAGDISIGAESWIQPFVWRTSASPQLSKLSRRQLLVWHITAENLARYRTIGAQWNIVNVVQKDQGSAQIAWLKQVLAQHKKYGISVTLRLMESPELYAKLRDKPSAQYGYDQNYYRWVTSIAEAMGGNVRFYLIGNEAELGVRHPGSAVTVAAQPIEYAQYKKVLITAVKAIKSVDPTSKVGNSGFSDSSVAMAVALHIYQSQGLTDAQKFWNRWERTMGGKGISKLGVIALLHNSKNLGKIRFLTQAIRDPADADFLQLHYYGGWSALPTMLKWISDQMSESGSTRPIVMAELGYRVASSIRTDGDRAHREMDLRTYSAVDHAENLAKDLAITLGSGIRRVLYWNLRIPDQRGKVMPLYRPTTQPASFIPTKAGVVFRTLAQYLNASAVLPQRLPDAAGLCAFHFKGNSEFSIAWSERPLQIAMPAGIEEIHTTEGRVLPRKRLLQLGIDPIIILWSSSVGSPHASVAHDYHMLDCASE